MQFPFRLLAVLLLLAALFGAPQTSAAEKPTVLITGANRGIGLALAREFSANGYAVIGTARNPPAATALEALGASVELLDVSDSDSVTALARRLADARIDILVNNAGIIGHDAASLTELDVDQLNAVFDVNALGPLRVIKALMPQVAAGNRKIVVNVSSMMGSMELNTWGCCLGYRASKAALNSLNKTLSHDLAETGMTFVVLHPGYVQTDMNEGRGNITPQASARGLFDVITGLDIADNGRFYDFQGKAMPW